MDDQNKADAKALNNVIQFPSRKKEAEAAPDATAPSSPEAKAKKAAKPKASKKTVAGTVLAIILMTVAVNKYTFETAPGMADMASLNGHSTGRQIASVERFSWNRDAQWEMKLANELASKEGRSIASTSIGRAATAEEKLRWGILEEKYTIVYSESDHKINTILLQDPVVNPSYILDRSKFLHEYGQLFEGSFDTAKLKSVEKSEDKTVESYTIFDKENNAKGEARFELDRHKRLISLRVEPVQI